HYSRSRAIALRRKAPRTGSRLSTPRRATTAPGKPPAARAHGCTLAEEIAIREASELALRESAGTQEPATRATACVVQDLACLQVSFETPSRSQQRREHPPQILPRAVQPRFHGSDFRPGRPRNFLQRTVLEFRKDQGLALQRRQCQNRFLDRLCALVLFNIQ